MDSLSEGGTTTLLLPTTEKNQNPTTPNPPPPNPPLEKEALESVTPHWKGGYGDLKTMGDHSGCVFSLGPLESYRFFYLPPFLF